MNRLPITYRVLRRSFCWKPPPPRRPLDSSDNPEMENRSFSREIDGTRDQSNFQSSYTELGQNLTPIDWNKEDPTSLVTSNYTEHRESVMTVEERKKFLQELSITVTSKGKVANPITKFQHLQLPESIQERLREFNEPSAIQKVALPVALSGSDVVGIAQTGSGKTLAFMLPCINHVQNQKTDSRNYGPFSLFMAPTRELALQILEETQKFTSGTGIRSVALYGGVPRYQQKNAIRNGVDIIISTPGRLLDFLESGIVDLRSVSYLVLDEADRMLDMGFEPQIRKIVSQIRPARQTLLFSATWPNDIQSLARDFCRDNTVKLVVGHTELQANPDVIQNVTITTGMKKKDDFMKFMEQNLNDRMVIFCETKRGADMIKNDLVRKNWSAESIHGDKDQRERDSALADFRAGLCRILVATDVAQRGLDIKDVLWVVNYDVPKTIEDYVHRIGRTGRAGKKGNSMTFIESDAHSVDTGRIAKRIADTMKAVGQEPSAELLDMGKKSFSSSTSSYSRRSSQRRSYG